MTETTKETMRTATAGTSGKAAKKKASPAKKTVKKTSAAKTKASTTTKQAKTKKAATKTTAARKSNPPVKAKRPTPGQAVTPELRWRMIAEAAYLRAEQRSFGGDPVMDWLAAEAEIDVMLKGG